MQIPIIPICCSATLVRRAVLAAGAVAPKTREVRCPGRATPAWDVSHERSRWTCRGSPRSGPGQRRRRARRTLDLIERLDAQRDRLWSYYRAVEEHHIERETLATGAG